MIRKYELLFLLNPSLKPAEVSKIKKEVEKRSKGKIIKQEDWGKKTLAYDIKKQKEAIYLLYYVEMDTLNVPEIKEMCRIDNNIIRHLILVHEKKWPFEMKTSKDIVFEEKRKPKFGGKEYPKKDFKKREYPKKDFPKKERINTNSTVKNDK